jgi:hypothetical protein
MNFSFNLLARLSSNGVSKPEISGSFTFPPAFAASIPKWVAVIRAVPNTITLVGTSAKTLPYAFTDFSLGDLPPEF